MKDIHWSNMNLTLLQKLQDNCATAMGMGFYAVDYQGKPITKPSNQTPFCELAKRNPIFAARCQQCDAHGGLQSAMTGGAYLYRCHANLGHFAIPVLENGNYIGAILGGQVRLDPDCNVRHILPREEELMPEPTLERAYDNIPVLGKERLNAAITLVQALLPQAIDEPAVTAQAVAAPTEEEPDIYTQMTQQYLDELREYIHCFRYKDSVATASQYLDDLVSASDDSRVIADNFNRFLDGLATLCRPFDRGVQEQVDGIQRRFSRRYDLHGNKFDTFCTAEEMLDAVFANVEETSDYDIAYEQRIYNFIDRRIRQGITLEEAAEYANMSTSYFSRDFKRRFQANFITYVTDRKMEMAQRMLRDTDRQITDIAYDLSYSEPNYFCKIFKKNTGYTPSEYRGQKLVEHG